MTSSTHRGPALPEAAMRVLVEDSPDVLVLLQPDGRCRHVSPASLSLLGHAPGSLAGAHLRDLVVEDDQHAVGDLLQQLDSGETCASAAMRVRHGSGGWVWMEGNARRAPAGAGAVLALRDITARKEGEAVMEEANSLLRRRAAEDGATGLANRGHFLSTLERELRRVRRDGLGLAVLAAELDGFALFVELYGHDAAEAAVCKAAGAVRHSIRRPGDLGGRLSDGVLGLLAPGTDLAGATLVANRLSEAVADLRMEHAAMPGGTLLVRVGIACSTPSSTAGELTARAEQAARKARAA